MVNIKIKYNEEYPNACHGILSILIDDKIVFRSEPYSFESTGGIFFTEDWDARIITGELAWADRETYDAWLKTQEYANEIDEAVTQYLSEFTGCI